MVLSPAREDDPTLARRKRLDMAGLSGAEDVDLGHSQVYTWDLPGGGSSSSSETTHNDSCNLDSAMTERTALSFHDGRPRQVSTNILGIPWIRVRGVREVREGTARGTQGPLTQDL